MNFNVIHWFDFNILIFMGMSLVFNASIVYLWHKKFYQKLGLISYQAIHSIHLNEIPRLGGLVLILSLISYVMYCPTNESTQLFKFLLICLIPIIVIGLKEDLFHNLEPPTHTH
jgi:UDP-N-acetylmuramyl pentapeptide phosphotransferase/UDP-N-acetylglucosamine-1-phosphate transferase